MRLLLTFVYTCWIWFETFFIMTLGVLLFVLAGPFLSAKRLNRLFIGTMAVCMRLSLCPLRLVTHPDFDPELPSVFCMNHVGIMDGHLASWSIPQSFTGLMLAWHFKIPAYGWIMRLTRGIPVYPRSSGRFDEVAAAARNRVAMGLSILTFPEGHRTLDGETKPFRRGMFFLARDTGIPVVPVAAHGMYAFNRKGSKRFFRTPITVYIGKQRTTDGLTDDEIGALAAELHAEVDTFVRTGEVPPA